MSNVKRTALAVAATLLGLLGLASQSSAGNSTVTFTAAQSTAIQNRLIPNYNANHCAQFGLGSSCTSANLVTAGCVVKTFGPVAVAITIDSCTIFTSNAAGEQSFHQERLNQSLVDSFNQRTSTDESARNTAYAGANQTSKDAVCVALGLPATNCQ